MKNLVLTVCFSLFPFISYSQTSSINLIDNLENSRSVSLSTFVEKVEYIPLETTEECLLSNELQVFVGDNDIIVGDQKAQKFYRFDSKGKFLNTIGKRGEGPEEYIYSISFYADKDYVYIIDANAKRLNKYSHDGKFIEKNSTDLVSWSLEKEGDNFICYNFLYNRIGGKEDVYELFLLDSKGKQIKKQPTTVTSAKDNAILFTFPFFYRYDGKIFYKNAVTEFVYRIDNKLNMNPAYQIIGGGNNNGREDYKDIQKYAKAMSVRDIFENDKLVIITYAFKNKLNYFVYDKSSKKGYNAVEGDNPGFKDDIMKGLAFEPLIGSRSSSNCIVSLKEAGNVIDNAKDLKQKGSIESLDYDDNPVLVIAHLK